MALTGYAHDVLEEGLETGSLLESGLRSLFRMFEEGVECTELVVKPLGGALFGANATPTLSTLAWGERAVAWILDRLLWTTQRRGEETRQRVHYGPLDVEDLGRVYEALLELEPGITSEEMCRLRRQKLEVVVPLHQGEKYRSTARQGASVAGDADDEPEETDEPGPDEDEQPTRGKKTKVEWIEAIGPGQFYLRVGLGRKASGSYYTPHSFVRFLVQETLGPQVAERSPPGDPQPLKILELKVLDPAMGSGHFLVEACRFLGDKLYEASRLCDEKALGAERTAEKAKTAERDKALEQAAVWRQRVIDLPDPDDELVKYLPSRSPEGQESGYSQERAEALCRRLVATHCVYGVDKNPLAVELAKLALWLEAHAEGMPLTFLDHRLVVGDSLTGPFWDKLIFRPGMPEQPIGEIFAQGLNLKLSQTLHEAIRYVRRLEATVGITVAEMREKEAVKANLDRALLPFRVAAAAWSGGVMLGPEHCDDQAYAELLQTIANTGDLPERIESEKLRAMIARGLGIPEAPAERERLREAVASGTCVPALSYDLTFPEVFYPTGVPHGRQGFHAVLGNPPWDRLEVKEEEYWSRFDLEVLSYSDKDARRPLVEIIANTTPGSLDGWNELNERFEQDWRIQQELYRAQSATIDGQGTTGRPDLYRVFAERGRYLLVRSGAVGWVLPSGFHANEGATGLRRLYLSEMDLRCCFSFENRKKLFEIDSRQKFAAIVAKLDGATIDFRCAFYLQDDQWLFGDRGSRESLRYTRGFIEKTGGSYWSFPECRTQVEADLLGVVNSDHTVSLAGFGESNRIEFSFGVELHRNPSFNHVIKNTVFGDLFTLPMMLKPDTRLPVFRGKAFWQYSDRGEYPIDVVTPAAVALAKDKWNPAIQYFRIAFRETASSTNERTLICAMLRPGTICNHKAGIEVTPHHRANSKALALLAILNSFFDDWQTRQKAGTNVNAFVLLAVRLPRLERLTAFLTHGSLRLSCNHAGYAPLWKEQLGDAWREAGKAPLTWPVLAGDDERWAVRAAIDAVVADAYGLSRDQYAHVLSTFSHASYKKAPELCLARFDELKQIGLDAFTKTHDPYWDIPLNEILPQPVIELPLPAAGDEGLYQEAAAPANKKKRRGKS